MKKTVKLLILLCMTLLLWTMVASADTYTDSDGNTYTYIINSSMNRSEITHFEGSGDVVIPEQLGGFKLRVIRTGAFMNCTEIESLQIPDSVFKIMVQAFSGCVNLKTVKLPSGLSILEDSAFGVCYALEKISIPGYVDRIEASAFDTCRNLTEIYISEGVRNIERQAFAGCRSVKKVTLPQSLTAIGDSAFYHWLSIETVEYTGSEGDWNKITIGKNNDGLESVPVRFLADECNHQFSPWDITSEPDCVKGGSRRRECYLCGYYVVEDLTPLGHDTEGVEWVRVRNPGCYYYGLEELTCNRCRKVAQSRDIPPTEEHIYDYEIVPPTCTEQGFTWYYCTEPYCGAYYYDDYTDIIDHSMSDWEWWDEPTCTRGVTKHRWCIACGLEETGEIPALGHDTEHAEWVIIQYAGCYNQGEEGLMCNRCYEPTERRLTPVRGHMYDEFYYEPTCTESGYIEHRCWECGYSYQEPYGEPRGHSFDEWQIVEYADCRNTGLKRRDCWSCYDYYEEEVIPTTGHLWDEWNVTFNPECENEGIKIRMCLYCTEEEVGSVPATGHCFGDWMPWDYDEFGEVTLEMRMCDICMKEEYRTPPATFTFIGTNKVGDNTKVYVNVKNMRNGDFVHFATYGDDGRFLGIHFAEVKNNYASVEIEDDDVANVKALLWNDGVKPVCKHASTDI